VRRILLSFVFSAAALTAGENAPLVQAVDSIGLTVSDLDRSIDFYSKVLSFEKVSESEFAGSEYEHLEGVFGLRMRTARLRLGGEYIELTEYLAPKGRPAPQDARANDRWFQHIAIITSDMDRAYKRLRAFKVQHASTGPQRLPDWNRNAAGIQAFYFRDPDGHFLEVLEFPPDKGDPKWHRSASFQNAPALFLGIDHTAIVISDTEASLKFYRDVLGMKVVGESENYGTEQEHLNNIFGARLRITSLHAAEGPGVEFLEYLAPRDGRPYPPEEQANDLIHWQTRFVGARIDEAASALQTSRSKLISTGVVELTAPDHDGKRQSDKAGFQRSIVVRDPDGHAVQLVQQ
jgi:catechol 2,3-dioxygenase-like lactoylglutathione lyase family enzyme